MMADGSYDVAVIGVGGMGSSTCYQLARQGQRVLGLERFDIPHSYGSSHGITRIIRLAYYEDPSYVPLMSRAYQLWDELEGAWGEKLLYKTGSIDAGQEDSWVFKGSLDSCLEHGLEHQVLDSGELTKRFPGYRLPAEYHALYQPEGGFLLPERCTVAYVTGAQENGAEIHARETLKAWEKQSDLFLLITDKSEYQARRLIFTTGAWNAKLLPALEGLSVPERQVLAWLQPIRLDWFIPDHFPVFNLQVPEGRYYGFPVFGIPGFKFGRYRHLEEEVDPDLLDREPHDRDERLLRDFAQKYFPQGAGPTMSLKACMFSNSPDDHFIIDQHPEHPEIHFSAGFSGHGYKFASVIGEILADLSIQGQTEHDISLFRLDRFQGRS